jgi:hypothetical protein
MPLAHACQLFLNKVRNDPDVMPVFNAFANVAGDSLPYRTFVDHPTKEGLIQFVRAVQEGTFRLSHEISEKYKDLILTIAECVTVTIDEAKIARQVEEFRSTIAASSGAITTLMEEIMTAMNPPHPDPPPMNVNNLFVDPGPELNDIHPIEIVYPNRQTNDGEWVGLGDGDAIPNGEE